MKGSQIEIVVATTILLSGLARCQEAAVARAGWISDESCTALHTKPGRADCVEKCWRGGASVGHPEWKPQRAVFIADVNGAIWIVDNPEAVKKFPAAHVMVAGKFDAAKKTVHVEKIETLKNQKMAT